MTTREYNSKITASTLQVILAKTFWQRLRGLIGRELKPDEGLLFRNANSLHTWFMTYNLDILYLDQDFRVLRIETHLSPWSISREATASHFLEIPSNHDYHINIGDQLCVTNRRDS